MKESYRFIQVIWSGSFGVTLIVYKYRKNSLKGFLGDAPEDFSDIGEHGMGVPTA